MPEHLLEHLPVSRTQSLTQSFRPERNPSKRMLLIITTDSPPGAYDVECRLATTICNIINDRGKENSDSALPPVQVLVHQRQPKFYVHIMGRPNGQEDGPSGQRDMEETPKYCNFTVPFFRAGSIISIVNPRARNMFRASSCKLI